MKKSIHLIADTLSRIINISFEMGRFPERLKYAKICPIYKNGAANEFSNYRPISVLPSFSKIFEKIVHERLYNYLMRCNILSDAQYGFRSKHSAYMALIDMYDKVTKSIDDRQATLGVFIDLQKAFDTVNFEILLKKLEHYGIRGMPLEWFNSYLTNRQQSVSLVGVLSKPSLVSCGVPQGSILGPLLFIIYINDIVNCSKLIHFILYADDTTLLFHAENFDKLFEKVNCELLHLSDWLRANMLSLNVKKSNYILFGNRLPDIDLSSNKILINDSSIEHVDVVKFLGVYIDNKLTWKHHISHLNLIISRLVGIMYKLRPKLADRAMMSMYNALILPHLMYGNIVWGCAGVTTLSRLVTLQKRSIRIITKSSFVAHTSPLFQRLRLMKVVDIYKYQVLQFVYNSRFPSSERSKCSFFYRFTYSFSPSCYNIRLSKRVMHIPYFRTELRRSSISCIGAILFNQFHFFSDVPSLAMLKKQLKLHFILGYNN